TALRQENGGRCAALRSADEYRHSRSGQYRAGTSDSPRRRRNQEVVRGIALAQDDKSPLGPSARPTDQRIVGAAPAGAQDEASAAAAVRDMFTSIATHYDLLNHVLSMNIDRVWWNRTARLFSEVLQRRDAQVLDLCCGTGDMTFALHRRLTTL